MDHFAGSRKDFWIDLCTYNCFTTSSLYVSGEWSIRAAYIPSHLQSTIQFILNKETERFVKGILGERDEWKNFNAMLVNSRWINQYKQVLTSSILLQCYDSKRDTKPILLSFSEAFLRKAVSDRARIFHQAEAYFASRGPTLSFVDFKVTSTFCWYWSLLDILWLRLLLQPKWNWRDHLMPPFFPNTVPVLLRWGQERDKISFFLKGFSKYSQCIFVELHVCMTRWSHAYLVSTIEKFLWWEEKSLI